MQIRPVSLNPYRRFGGAIHPGEKRSNAHNYPRTVPLTFLSQQDNLAVCNFRPILPIREAAGWKQSRSVGHQ
jgi:hypothetical protein